MHASLLLEKGKKKNTPRLGQRPCTASRTHPRWHLFTLGSGHPDSPPSIQGHPYTFVVFVCIFIPPEHYIKHFHIRRKALRSVCPTLALISCTGTKSLHRDGAGRELDIPVGPRLHTCIVPMSHIWHEGWGWTHDKAWIPAKQWGDWRRRR